MRWSQYLLSIGKPSNVLAPKSEDIAIGAVERGGVMFGIYFHMFACSHVLWPHTHVRRMLSLSCVQESFLMVALHENSISINMYTVDMAANVTNCPPE